jgi:APA family basic amino acid/polyamine antiporter
MTSEEKKPSLFLRTATGLVRPWSAWDGFIYNVLAIQPCVVLAFSFLNGLAIAPAGDMILALLITGIFCTFLAFNEAGLIATMPRSGGDYIFQSRILGGSIGFILNWTFIIVMQTIWLAFPAWWGAEMVISPFLTIFGSTFKIPALVDAGVWLSHGDGFFILGIFIILWSTIINLAGMVWYRRAQKACFYVAIAGMIIMMGMLAATTPGTFAERFNDFVATTFGKGPGAYQAVLDKAYELGFSTAGNLWSESFIMAIPLAMAFMFPAWSAFNAGEIKGAGSLRSQVFQVVIAEIFSVALSIGLYALLAHTMSDLWYKAACWLYWNHPDAWRAIAGPIPPYFGFLTGLIFKEPLAMFVVFITFQAWFWMWYPNITLAVSRCMLAMSFDRVFPEKVGKVHPKLRAPHVAIIIIMLFGWLFMWFYAYTNFAEYILMAPMVSILGFAGTALAGALLPYIRKDLFQISPLRKWYVGRIPLITIAGGMWVLFSAITFGLFTYETRLFFFDPLSFIFFVGVYLSGAIVYFAYKAYRRKQGIDVSLVYKEIPVE